MILENPVLMQVGLGWCFLFCLWVASCHWPG